MKSGYFILSSAAAESGMSMATIWRRRLCLLFVYVSWWERNNMKEHEKMKSNIDIDISEGNE